MVLATTQHHKDLYETDYHLWLVETAHLLKTRQLRDLDIEHLLEEVLDVFAQKPIADLELVLDLHWFPRS